MIALLALLFATVLCDMIGQICFKYGLHQPDFDGGNGLVGFVGSLLRSPWIVCGVGVYLLEFVLWFAALSRAPLSMAVPFAALSYCGVVIASRFVLQESVSARRWFGTGLIAVGVFLACISDI